jgi:hypothetical protein
MEKKKKRDRAMKCPHCKKETPFLLCNHCGKYIENKKII